MIAATGPGFLFSIMAFVMAIGVLVFVVMLLLNSVWPNSGSGA